MSDAKKVIDFFREFSAIPHASFDEKRISDYLVSFARSRGLEVRQDEFWNVLIKKPATVGDCKCAPVIIQGHMDMVYVRSEDCARSYEDGIAVVERDGWLCAEGTTLGADNGVAVAYALALLDSNELSHPDLEVIITVQEEVGLVGAERFDCFDIKGKYFMNLDTEDEGVFYTSCAGAFRNDLTIPVEREPVRGKTALKVVLGGLHGGHSGMEIHLGRGNAVVLMARLLDAFNWDGAHLASLSCDGKMNAIASCCEALLYLDPQRVGEAVEFLEETVAGFNRELEGIDIVTLRTQHEPTEELSCYTQNARLRAISALLLMPNGVLEMSRAIEGLVQTSANPGILTQEEEALTVASCVRSSVAAKKAEAARRLEAIAHFAGGKSVCSKDYPAWEYRSFSPLREEVMRCYRELSGKEPKTAAIHAGLECGCFDGKMQGLDIISFGPDQRDVHTPKERVSMQSLENTWRLICRVLEELAKTKK